MLESLVGDDDPPADVARDGTQRGPPARGRARRRRRGLGRRLPGRRDPALPAGHAVHPVPGHRAAGQRAAVSDEAAADSRGRLAAHARVAGCCPAFRMLLLPLVAGRRHARFLRLHQADRIPPVRRLRHRDRDGVRRPGGDLHGQRAPLQPGAGHRADPAAQHAADRLVRSLLGRGPAPLPAGQQADRGRRRLVRVDRAARRPGRARRSATSPGTACAPRSRWAGCGPRSRR